MPGNIITEFTRRDLFDRLSLSEVKWSGRLDESEFLERVFSISKLPSNDRRTSDMQGEVFLHRDHFHDWGGPEWIYAEPRLDLMGCPDQVLLRFLAEMLHPLVRPDQKEVDELLVVINSHLVHDGFQLAVKEVISGKRIFIGVSAVGHHALGIAEAARIADTMASDHVMGQVSRMKDSVLSDPALAIGSAKEFVESVAKGILRERGIQTKDNEPLPSVRGE